MAMISLSDAQLKIVMAAAAPLPIPKREIFLWRLSSRLQLQHKFNDADVNDAIKLSLFGLLQQTTAA
jgi:hypothetical protein